MSLAAELDLAGGESRESSREVRWRGWQSASCTIVHMRLHA